LQVIYIVLGVLGWYWWLRGGTGKTELPVSRTGVRTAIVLASLLAVSTAGLAVGLARVNDAAPFWDALTTVLSLVAQYMLSRKLIENWFVWMTADVIYVALYVYKHLNLTAGLYAIFFALCVAGFLHWRASLRVQYGAPGGRRAVVGRTDDALGRLRPRRRLHVRRLRGRLRPLYGQRPRPGRSRAGHRSLLGNGRAGRPAGVLGVPRALRACPLL